MHVLQHYPPLPKLTLLPEKLKYHHPGEILFLIFRLLKTPESISTSKRATNQLQTGKDTQKKLKLRWNSFFTNQIQPEKILSFSIGYKQEIKIHSKEAHQLHVLKLVKPLTQNPEKDRPT